MSIPLQRDPPFGRDKGPLARVVPDGKFLRAGSERFLVKGVTYGTFAPDARGIQFPHKARVAEDFRQMAGLGINTVRVYTPPPTDLLDEAAEHGLRVMIGLPWSQHVAFLDDARFARRIRRELVGTVRSLSGHPAALLFTLGNEIPAGVVRWHGRRRVERFLHRLYSDAKDAAPDCLFAYANFPPTEFLDLSFFDVCAFNVYLHREPELRAYLARLQHVAGPKPLLLAEAGADSQRQGEEGQAAITAMHVRAALEEGACGAIAYAWTDEWWRGGAAIEDWSFGLVDRERRPKPAAAAVSEAFADAPFSASVRASWPRVSVVVCAYNAADTLEDCLSSLERLSYPDFEVLLVNDGSKDRTSSIGRSHMGVRVIDTPNRGLSSARNEGLAAATGEVVAYVDADVRVDRDWLTYLVQPLLGSENVVGSGGPNVVPPDDPPTAQAVARSPGGPTHVLLEDRVAEHVPGCNMAFRRNALLSIGGFNPIYLRAGDDVDVCWRLQARGWTIGFAPAALVWHHHRASVRGYWRQQVGYGEGETWLMTHHPEKFLDGRMLWRGRIYSPLPFVRSLWGTRVNSGVWGTAAFPSVYRTDAHLFAFLPHSMLWQAVSGVLVLAGGLAAALDAPRWAVALLLATGLGGVLVTIARNVTYALRSDLAPLTGPRLGLRAAIAWLHFLQPIARAWGRVRGTLTPPEVAQRTPAPAEPSVRPSLRDGARAARLLFGGVIEDRFWSETWTSADQVLARLTAGLHRSRPGRRVAVDDGWSEDRDVSLLVGRWAWLDLRALVEEHERGRCLLRVGTSLRPTVLGVTAAVGIGAALTAAVIAGLAYRWPLASAVAALTTLGIGLFTATRTTLTSAIARQSVERVAASHEMLAFPTGPAPAPLSAPSLLHAYGLRSIAALVVTIFWFGAGTLLLRRAAIADVTDAGTDAPTGTLDGGGPGMSVWLDTPGGIAVDAAGDILVVDSHVALVRRIDGKTLLVSPFAGSEELGAGFSGDGGPATAARLNEPDGVAIAPDGDVLIADSQNHRIRRVDRETGIITTIAGSGEATFDGDGKPALETALDQPSAVASAANGDIYIADTMNNRIRRIDHASGLIHTVAGDGQVTEMGPVGDGGPATAAQLYMPSDVAVAPNGDVYIADMHHNRVRRIDATTGVITTVAGDGLFGKAPDGVLATEASLAGPAGIAVMMGPDAQTTLFIADSYNALVRMVGPDGVMRIVSDGSGVTFAAPSRVAYAPTGGWLYVGDAMEDKLVALIPQVSVEQASAPPGRPGRTDAPDR